MSDSVRNSTLNTNGLGAGNNRFGNIDDLLAQIAGDPSYRPGGRRYRRNRFGDIGGTNGGNSPNSRRYGGGANSNTRGDGYSSIGRLQAKYIRMFDEDGDGAVSDEEAIRYLLAMRASGLKPSSKLFSVNQNAQDFSKVIETFDTNIDAEFNSQEIAEALLALRTEEFSDLSLENALKVLRHNSDADDIKDKVDFVDADSDGVVSDLEVLDTILAARRSEVDLNDENLRTVLNTNQNFGRILELLESIDGNFDGVVSDQDVFNTLMGLRSGDLSDDLALMSLFIRNNPNVDEIAGSIDLFDSNSDGAVSEDEYLQTVLAIRKGEHNLEDHDIVSTLLETEENFANLKLVLENIDNDSNGEISNQEVIDFALAVRRGDLDLNQGYVDLILANNENTEIIRSLISTVDSDSNGEVSNPEVFAAILALRKGEINQDVANVLTEILSTNSNREDIFNALTAVDTNLDGVVSKTELISGLIAQRRGELDEFNSDYVNMALESNSDYDLMTSILDIFGAEANPSDVDLAEIIISVNSGSLDTIDQANFDEVFAVLDDKNVKDALAVFDSDADGSVDDREYTRGLLALRSGEIQASDGLMNYVNSLNTHSQIIFEAISILDADNNGQVNAHEFVDNFTASVSVDGQVDFERLSITSDLMDIIYPDAAKLDEFRDAIDVNNDNELSDQELIDALFAIRDGSLEDPGQDIVDVVLSGNANFQSLLGLVDSIDADQDGIISDAELVSNSLKVRKGEFAEEDLGYVQAILMRNSKHDSIQGLINLFDKNANGQISDLELFDALIQLRDGSYSGEIIPEIVDALIAENTNNLRIQNILNEIDPDANGRVDYDELVAGFLALTKDSILPSDEIFNAMPNTDGVAYGADAKNAYELIDDIDANDDGEISNQEIAGIILLDRKDGVLGAYKPELVDAVLAANPHSAEIKNIIETLDANGDGEFSDLEVLRTLMDIRAGRVVVETPSLLDDVLANIDGLENLNRLIDDVDKDGDGDVSQGEVVATVMALRRQDINYKQELVDLVLGLNSDYSSIVADIDSVDQNKDGQLENLEVVDALLAVNAGSLVLNSITDPLVKSNSSFDDIEAAVALVDSDGDGIVSDRNVMDTVLASIRGEVSIPSSIVNLVLSKNTNADEIINSIQIFDLDDDGSIERDEFIEILGKIFSGEIAASDHGVVLGLLLEQSEYKKIYDTIDLFDPNGDGQVNDQEAVEGLLAFRKGGVELDSALFDLFKQTNADFSIIEKLLDTVDTERIGRLPQQHVLAHLQATVGALTGNQNPAYDFNSDGRVDMTDLNIIKALYRFSLGQGFAI